MALYEELVENKLKVSSDFLTESATVIRERLEHAAVEFKLEHGNFFAINMCLHAASSIILSNPKYLNATLEKIKKTDVLKEKDATTVLTVSALYWLLVKDWDSGREEWVKTHPEYQKNLDKLHAGFDEVNWLVGQDAMRVLGIKTLKEKKPGPSALHPSSNARKPSLPDVS